MISADRLFALHVSVAPDAPRHEINSDCVEAVIGTAQQSWIYHDQPDNPLVFIAYLVRNVALRHCFVDGNKRLAFAALKDVLAVALGAGLDADEGDAAAIVIDLVEHRIDVPEFVEWLAEHVVAWEDE